MGYSYFDTPDGEDCLKKLLIASKHGVTFGLFASALDVVALSHPKGYAATAARFGYITVPFVGIAATFTSTTCLLAGIRQKDDNWNYAVGGMAAGSIIGVWQKSIQKGILFAGFFGILAAFTKQGLKDGWYFWNPNTKQSFGDFWTINYDLSITKERPKSWVTDK